MTAKKDAYIFRPFADVASSPHRLALDDVRAAIAQHYPSRPLPDIMVVVAAPTSTNPDEIARYARFAERVIEYDAPVAMNSFTMGMDKAPDEFIAAHPHGVILVTEALLNQMLSQQIASIMTHEYGHVLLSHIYQSPPSFQPGLDRFAMSRIHECEADHFAMRVHP